MQFILFVTLQMQLKSENVKVSCARDSKDMKIDLHTLISDINGCKDSANFNMNDNLIDENKLSVAKITRYTFLCINLSISLLF